MKIASFVIFLLFVSFPTRSQSPDQLSSMVDREAKTFLAAPNAVGISIGIYKDGRIYTFNYGSTIKGKSIVASSNTPYCIASLSKTFAGLLLAYAVTEKKVKPDDDIRLYLDGQYPNLEFNQQPI